jgi:hypothetical protein
VRGVRLSLIGAALFALGVAATSSSAASAAAPQTPARGTQASGASASRHAIVLGATSGTPVNIVTDPVGLSVEYPVLAADLGTGSCPPPALVSTIEGLGAPTIRIGGDSGDETAPAGTPPFAGVTDLPAPFWSQLACLESQTHEPFVIGLNLASQMPAWAATMAAGARSAVPASLLSFEIGNEADIDGPAVPWWNATAQAKSLLPFQTYLDDAEAVAEQLGTGAIIEGPDFATPRWTSKIPEIAKALPLHAVDAHFYPLNACTGLRQATVKALLARGASEPDGALLATLAQAESAHLPMVISESNSVACRGKPGVSDSPASAVWGLRVVINMIMSGIQSVRFHSSGSSYDPFVVSGDTVTTRPLYLGLEAAVQLLPVGATVIALQTPKPLSGVLVSAPSGHTSYILTNYAKSPRLVTVRSAAASATLLSVTPSAAVVTSGQISASRGELRVSVAPNSVVAITPA